MRMEEKMNQQEENFDNINFAETKDETDKKCPQCGGIMDFDPKTGHMKCGFCDYEEEIAVSEEEPKKAEELDFDLVDKTANKNWGAEKKTVICEACGAETIYDALQTSAVCPFCGSNQVMEANDQDTIAPGGVVPFQVNDKEASRLFKEWIKKKWFCPRLAKESARPKSFNGIYLPYWTFDTNTFSTYTGQYGIDREVQDDDEHSHTETDWYSTSGTYNEFIDDELILASDRHDSNMLHKLEPFDTENNKAYKPEYVAGFVAERYALGVKDAWKQAKKAISAKLKRNVEDKIENEHNADHTRRVILNTSFNDVTYKYLLLPIWVSNFKYKDKVYQFMVNGQTGKIAGKTPLSIPKIIITVAVALLAAGIIYYIWS